MLDRALFAARRFWLDLGSWLGFWKLSIVLMVLAGAYYLLLAVWATSAPPDMVRNIALLVPFWAVYGLLLVNTGTCLWRRRAALRRDLGKRPQYRDRPPGWEYELPPNTGPNEARRLLRKAGYRVRDGESLEGVRGRWAVLGSYLFHGSFFFLGLGFLLTFTFRAETVLRVAEGEIPELAPQFVVRGITPEFWQDRLLFTRLEADLGWPDGSRSVTRINRPVMVGSSSYLRLSGFGYVPRYELVNREGAVLDSVWVKMNVFPPGLRDWFTIEGYPHRVYMSVDPDPAGSSLNLVEPRIDLEVYRGQSRLSRASVELGEGVTFEGLAIRIAEIRYWGEFSLVRDPGALWVFAGFAIGVLGLILRLPGERSEALYRPGVDGSAPRIAGWGEQPARLGDDS
jgi:hypothetical protein